MKKITIGLLVIVFCLLQACNNDTSSVNTEPTSEEMVSHNLKRHGVPYTIQLPKSKMQLLIDSMQSFGDLTIDMGKTFNLVISPSIQSMADMKKDISSNEVNKLKNYIVEEANTILYMSEIVSPEYHFKHIAVSGKDTFLIMDALNKEGTPYSEAEIKLMLECAKTLKPVQ
jgi:hypothetical protein